MDVSSSAFFLTLTYNDEHLPEGGELSLYDLQTFIKRLRKENPGIRYFAVGEYGTDLDRPHYHAVLFNLVDLNLVTKHWHHGFVKGSRANAGRIRYMVSYMALPADHKHKTPPFRVMSRNPGIGKNYVTQMGDFHRARSDCVVHDFDQPNAMPRYYMEKIYTPGQRRYINHKRMLYSLDHPTEISSEEHDRLWKKLNRKNK